LAWGADRGVGHRALGLNRQKGCTIGSTGSLVPFAHRRVVRERHLVRGDVVDRRAVADRHEVGDDLGAVGHVHRLPSWILPSGAFTPCSRMRVE
jgi:hypothetical protein